MITVQNLVEGLQRGLVADHNLVSCNQRCLDYARAAFAEDPSLQADFGTPEALVSYLKAAAVKGASTKAQVVAQYPQVECQEATDPAMVRIAAAIGNQSKPLSLAQLERALGDGLVVALSELRERPAAVAARIFANDAEAVAEFGSADILAAYLANHRALAVAPRTFVPAAAIQALEQADQKAAADAAAAARKRAALAVEDD